MNAREGESPSFRSESLPLVARYLSTPEARTDSRVVEGWEGFWNEFRPFIEEIAKEKSRRWKYDPEDAAQAAWDVLMSKLPKHVHDDSRGTLRAWVAQVVRRAIINHVRSNRRIAVEKRSEEWMRVLWGRLDKEHAREPYQDLEEMLEAIRRESEIDYQVFAMKYFENRTDREIGAALGMTLLAARKRRARVIAELRRRMNPDEGVE